MSIAKTYDYNFSYYSRNAKATNYGLPRTAALQQFKIGVIRGEQMTFGIHYEPISKTSLPTVGTGDVDLLIYEPNFPAPIICTKDTYGEIAETSEIEYALTEISVYLEEYIRANTNMPTIAEEFLHRNFDNVDSIDTVDVTFERIVTVTNINKPSNKMDSYDKFCRYVYDNVYVISSETDGNNAVCDWEEFIMRNYFILSDLAIRYWNHIPDDEDDFIEEWIAEMHALLAGYGSDEIYNIFINAFENSVSSQYDRWLIANIIPNMSNRTKEYIKHNQNSSFKNKCLGKILMDGETSTLSDKISNLQSILENNPENNFAPEEIASFEEKLFKLKHIVELWEDFGDIPMNPVTEEIESPWHGFPAGTFREDIWHWFESEFEISVGKDLLNT
jgi:hypothetical protein